MYFLRRLACFFLGHRFGIKVIGPWIMGWRTVSVDCTRCGTHKLIDYQQDTKTKPVPGLLGKGGRRE